MAHPPSDVEIKLSWENLGPNTVHIRYEPAGGGMISVDVKRLETTERIPVFLPESKIVFKIDNIQPLSLRWESIGGDGRFIIVDKESHEWFQFGDVFTLGDSSVIFNYAEGGIVITGGLNIGG